LLLSVITVTTTSDSGPGTTLRDAITTANQNTTSSPTTIDFDVAQATGSATVFSGSVTSIQVTNAGGGYSSLAPPVVTLMGGGGTGATATATVTDGVITSFNVTSQGQGYSTSPTVVLNPGTAPFEIQPTSALPTITAPVTIDGTSQPGFPGAPIMQIDGTSLLGQAANGLELAAGAAGSTIEGLAITGFTLGGGDGSGFGIAIGASGVSIIGNYIGLDTTGAAAPNAVGISIGASGDTVGGTTAASRNVISGNYGDAVQVVGATNLFEGNYIGTDPTGSTGLGNGGSGFDVFDASGNTFGGTTAAARNVIADSGNAGVLINSDGAVPASGNVVIGNYIGTDVTGKQSLGNASGVELFGVSGNTVGGATAAARNVISGNAGSGIEISAPAAVSALSSSNVITGNFIGTDAGGASPLGNRGNGVMIIGGASGNTVGGTAAGTGNVIAFNALAGVVVGLSASSGEVDDAILGNSIFSNGKLGIDLGDDGVTMNTPGGPHSGPNQLQNYPVINSVTISRGGTLITGSLNSTPNSSFTVQLFASAAADPSGFGQGQTLLGEVTVPTDSSGNGAFSMTVNAPPGGQTVFTATATDPSGNTSEFSQAFTPPSLVVTNTNDSGPGSLRQAILNANTLPGLPTITFAIDSPGVQLIEPLTPLPTITNPVIIDGTTQPGYGGTPLIEVSGSLAGASADGLNIASSAPGSIIQALAINNFGSIGVNLGSSNDQLIGNYIGVDATAHIADANGTGIMIAGDGDTVGGAAAADRNVISGNDGVGIQVSATLGTLITNNYIGLDPGGVSALPNQSDGINVSVTGTVGPTAAITDNVISGNERNGIYLDGAGVTGVVITGNLIGTNANAAHALGNGNEGVAILNASGNTVGGTTSALANVIAGNSADGVLIQGIGGVMPADNLIEGNFIGTNTASVSGLGNTDAGVDILNGSSNTVGGTATGAGNVISANGGFGVEIQNNLTPAANGNLIQGNMIGTTAAGTAALGNIQGGVRFLGAVGDTLGGATTAARNVISGNMNDGVHLDSSSSSIVIAGNYIGTTAAGTGGLGNTGNGVSVSGSSNITVGGATAGDGNVISGNAENGVSISSGSGNRVQGNFIGTAAGGTSLLGNQVDGVVILSAGNTVGGTTAATRNIISGNGLDGVSLNDNGANDNLVEGNYIGTDVTGTSPLGNLRHGVSITSTNNTTNPTGTDNTIGGSVLGAGNVISGNGAFGLVIFAPNGGGSGNVVEGNFIGTDFSGAHPLGNTGDGIVISSAAGNTVGGTTSSARNIISSNGKYGIDIEGATSTGNLVEGNYIGTDVTGKVALGNTNNGVNIQLSASANTIGGVASGAGNVIAAGATSGVVIQSGATQNRVQGNFIGTDATGAAALGNMGNGVGILDASSNTIGGTTAAARNVISGNTGDGVLLTSDGNAATSSNVVEGNFVGTDLTGTTALANGADGVSLDAAVSNAIGGAGGAANLISGNQGAGVNLVSGSNNNTVQGNLIGTDATGTLPLGNLGEGVSVDGSTGDLIGGTAAGTGNVISANMGAGVDISGGGNGNTVQGNDIGTQSGGVGALGNHDVGVVITTSGNTLGGTTVAARNIIADNASNGVALDGSGNLVEGNFIGVLASGTATIGNQGDGVFVGGSSNTVGGTATGAGNLISGNTQNGVAISGGAANTLVQGNDIGTDASGTMALGNALDGVAISGAGTTGNTVGGTTSGSVNLISGNMGAGVDIFASASGNLVAGNFIGTDITGTKALGNSLSGVVINDASGNTVGGTTSGARNLISANVASGVLIESDGTGPASNNVIEGNDIGTDVHGTAALGNQVSGVSIQAASSNTVGGTSAGADNLISGNVASGVVLDLTGATGNEVQGNDIGTDVTGKVALGNKVDGVFILNGASNNLIGGTVTGSRNIISGNGGRGVEIDLTASTGNQVQGNFIGTDITGAAALGNGSFGVILGITTGNLIGGTASGAGNVISGNAAAGVLISGGGAASTPQNNQVEGNLIGTDSTGGVALGNAGGGVEIMDSSGNTVGGTATGARNVISGNTGVGVLVTSDGTAPASGNLIAGNFIGTDATGALALGNSSNGVQLDGASSNTVGGTALSARNIISANAGNGVLVQSSGTSNNVIAGNFIGTDVTGEVGKDTKGNSLGNTDNGIELFHASQTTVGGTATGSGNVVSNNGQAGVAFAPDSSTDNNVVEGNLIGTDAAGGKALGNTSNGVVLSNSFSNTIGGTTAAARNVISGNKQEGIFIGFVGSATSPALDVILGNYIGPDVTGLNAIGNGLSGVTIQDSVGVTIGGTATGAGNLISGNGPGTQPGISIAGASQDNVVQGNLIGTDKTGLAPLGGKSSQSNNLGIVLSDNGGETIGGTAAGAGNTIAFNASTGVLVIPSTTPYNGTQIVGNTIKTNGSDGINFFTNTTGQVDATLIATNSITGNTRNGVWVDGPSGTTISDNTISGNANDGVKVTQGTGNSILTDAIFNNTNLAIELASGGNNSQAAPVLTSATLASGGTTITGTLQAAPSTLYHLQFFSSPTSTPPGFGEAETFLTDLNNVMTSSSGLANFTANVPASAFNQYLTATATNQATNDTSQVSKTSPNLLVALAAQPEPVNQTQDLTYTINLANNGASPTTGITVTDTLPSGVTFISASGGGTFDGVKTVTFPTVDLNPTQSMVYTIVVRADTSGTLSNTATATYTNESDNPDIDPTKLTQTVASTVNPVANLTVTGDADQASVVQGTNLTYTDIVFNGGPSPSAGVTLTDTLPSGVTFISATGGVTPVNNVLTFNLGTIAASAKSSVTIVVQPTAPGTIVNTGEVTSRTTDLGNGPHTFSVSTTVTPAPPTFVITNTNDSGVGSLRQVLLNVNAAVIPGAITIGVEIPGPGPYVIQPTTALPAILNAMTLDSPVPLVIDGSKVPAGPTPTSVAQTPGLLDVDAPDVTLEGLTITGFAGFGVVLGSNSGSDTVSNDNIGTNAAPNATGGVLVLSKGNTIGTAQAPNAILGNAFGVYLDGSGATGNMVLGNTISNDGSQASIVDGVEVDGAIGNTIAGNTIKAYQAGIYLFDGASGNVIQANAIEKDGVGSNSVQELGGILLSGASGNTIGGTSSSAGNVIANNAGSGVVLFNGAMGNVIAANMINNNASTGVYIVGGTGNTIGGTSAGLGNTIMGNTLSGVDLQGSTTTGNLVLGNTIENNQQNGVYIFNASNNTIGMSTASPGVAPGNLIEGNSFNGVDLDSSSATGNVVQGNTIANQASGYGVLIENGATGNTIGGSGGAANALQNNALGNIQVLINGLPPSGNTTGGNTFGGNTTTTQNGNALTAAILKKHHHVKPAEHAKRHHPHGPRVHLKTRSRG
jgi:parallel beta-helix repeat protein